MIVRVALGVVLVLGLLGAPLMVEAQNLAPAVRIGWLGLGSPGPEVLRTVGAFREGLHQLGYVEGQNLAFEYRWAHGRSERLADLAAELVRRKVSVIAVATTQGASVARQATGTIPIVFMGADADALGLGSRLARPGGNVTGVSFHAGPEIGGKYLELLREAAPRTSRVALLVRPDNSSHALVTKETEAAARSAGIQLQSVSAKTADDLDPAFATMARARVDGLIVLPDPIFLLHRQRLAHLAARSGLPAMYGLTQHAEVGGLMAYSANQADMARRAAAHVDRILKGARAGDLPVERPIRFDLIINVKTATTLGLTIAPSLLARADRMIE